MHELYKNISLDWVVLEKFKMERKQKCSLKKQSNNPTKNKLKDIERKL